MQKKSLKWLRNKENPKNNSYNSLLCLKVVTLMKEYTDLLSAFTNKIKTINKNGKFITENEG